MRNAKRYSAMVPTNTVLRTKLPPRHPATRAINTWTVCLVAVGIGLASLYMAVLKRQTHSSSKSTDPRVAVVSPEPVVILSTPALVQIAPRAIPVPGPLTNAGTPMISGNQYYVTMPDGRHLLVNYKGWVDHACNLPRQPKGGANNAAYTEAATGHMWIWTVPAGTNNVPQWIDP